jgi:hypothetical protein
LEGQRRKNKRDSRLVPLGNGTVVEGWGFYTTANQTTPVAGFAFNPNGSSFSEVGKKKLRDNVTLEQAKEWIEKFETRFATDGTISTPWSDVTIDPDQPSPVSADIFNPPGNTNNDPKKDQPKKEDPPKSDKTSTSTSGGNTTSTSSSFTAPGVKTEVTQEFDLTRIKYIAEFGGVTINLPSNLRPGDTFTGSFYPSGNNDAELVKNFNNLGNYSFNFVGDGALKPGRLGDWGPLESPTPPDKSHNYVGNRMVTPSQAYTLSLAPKAMEIYWRNDLAARIELPIARETRPLPSSFWTPTGGQQGGFLTIPGPFDGIMSPTDFTKIGGIPVPTIAESPYGRVVWNTSDNIGQSNIEVSEHGQTGSCPFHNVSVALSANNLNLKRGQHAEVTVTFTGLGRLNQDMPYELVNHSPGVVHMAGGAEAQSGMVPASKVANPNDAHGGTYSDKIGITGVSPGSFTITATLRWKETCNLPFEAMHKNVIP